MNRSLRPRDQTRNDHSFIVVAYLSDEGHLDKVDMDYSKKGVL